MRLNFRQGIARARAVLGAPDFLTYNNTFSTVDVNITEPWLIVSAAFKDKNYLLEERANQSQSWGPFLWDSAHWGAEPPVVVYQLYWDVNLATGAVTKGYTPWAPLYGATQPTSPRIDQHWFDTTEYIMFVWDGAAWQQKCRVFAAAFGPNTVSITHRPFFSQVGLNVECLAGYITYGEDLKGVRLDDGTFLTSSTDLVVNTGRYSSPINLEAASTAMVAAEAIPAFSCVTNSDLSECRLANPFNVNFYPIGVATKEAVVGEAVEFMQHGVLYNDQWDWDFDLGKDIYCGVNGVLYQGAPELANSGELKVGTILSAVSIQVHIDRFGISGGNTGMGPLDHDVEIIGTSVGAKDEGYTFPMGMTFSEFVEAVSKRTLPPSYGGPSMSISANPSPTNFEIGTIISPIISRSLSLADAGPENATTLSKNSILIATAYPHTDNNVLLDDTPVVYVGSTSYDEGACKLDNMGNEDCTGHVLAGTVTSNTITFIGSRVAFFGGITGATPATSAGVRALGNSSFNSSNNSTVDDDGVAIGGSITPNFVITIPIGTVRVVFAYPATSRAVASVRYQELADSEVKANFVQTTVSVEGAGGYTAIPYRVYTYTPVEPFSIVNHYRVFI